MSEKDSAIIRQNEKEANHFVVKVMFVTAAVLTLILILNIVGIFIIQTVPMIIAYVLGIVMLMIPVAMVKLFHMDDSPATKYVAVTASAAFVSIMIVTLNWHAIVAFIFAVGVASLYFSRSVNVYATVLSIVLYSIAQIIAYKFGFTEDRNEINMYHTVVYCIVPRAMALFAMSSILLTLNARTTKMLKNLLDVDAQARMMNQMKRIKEKSADVSESLTNAVGTLSVVTDNTTTSSEQIADKADKVATGSGNTLSQINEVGSNIKNISENLSKLASRTDEISTISDSVMNLTKDNTDNMDKALEGFEHISKSTEDTKNIIGELENKTKEIMKITEVITSIAKRTSLLALNASIESARAGEAGKGFAVVANEIRDLSEQTNGAVNNISSIIEQVVDNTMQAVNAMEESAELVSDGMVRIKSAGDSTRMVTKASDEMHDKIVEIDEVTNNVSQYSEKIVTIVKDVQNSSSQNLSSLEEITAANEQEMDDMKRLQELVISIKKMSGELDEVTHME